MPLHVYEDRSPSTNNRHNVESEVLTVVTMKSSLLVCNTMEFKDSQTLQRNISSPSSVSKSKPSKKPTEAGFSLGIPFNSEHAGDMLLQNVGMCSNYRALQPTTMYSQHTEYWKISGLRIMEQDT
jgi:hypothetical protein